MRAFFDSNILVYALSDDDAGRRSEALALLARHGRSGGLVISTQVLMETYNVLVRKKRVLPADALASMRLLARHEVVAPGAEAALAALELAAQHSLATWDALIVQAAIESGCEVLFSEDMQAGRRFGSLEVVNPFDLRAHEPGPPLAVPPARSVRSAGKSSKTRPSSRAR